MSEQEKQETARDVTREVVDAVKRSAKRNVYVPPGLSKVLNEEADQPELTARGIVAMVPLPGIEYRKKLESEITALVEQERRKATAGIVKSMRQSTLRVLKEREAESLKREEAAFNAVYPTFQDYLKSRE